MPVFKFTSPDGKVYRVTAPEGATQDEAFLVLQNNISNQKDKAEKSEADSSSPYGDGGNVKKAALGVARGVADIGNTILKLPGLKQIGQAGYELLGGTGSREGSLSEMDKENAGGAYSVGRIAGNIAATLPVGGVLAAGAKAVPSLAKLAPALQSGGMNAGGLVGKQAIAARLGAGATVGGASAGLIDPSDVGTGAAVGAVAPYAIQAAVRGGQGAYRGARAMVQPWTGERGQALAASDVLRYLNVPGVKMTPGQSGVTPTLAEALAQSGKPIEAETAARLLDSMSVRPDIGPSISQALRENNAGRLNALKGLGGQAEIAKDTRSAVAGPMYQDALAKQLDLTAPEIETLTQLSQRPAIKQAMESALSNLRNRGDSEGISKVLHEAQMALRETSDNLRKPITSAASASGAESVDSARAALLQFLESVNQPYAKARSTYRELSAPVNQQQLLDEIYNKAAGAMTDISGNPKMQAGSVLRSVRGSEESLVKQATEGRVRGGIDDVLSPSQSAQLRSILDEIDRSAAVGSAAVGSNSATARRAYGSNVLHQLLGPMGVSRGAIESPFVQNLMRIPTALARVPEDRVQEQLAKILLGQSPLLERNALNLSPLERALRPVAVPLAIQE